MKRWKSLLSGWLKEMGKTVSPWPTMLESVSPPTAISFSGTTRTEPAFLATEVWRQVRKNNKGIGRINFEFWTSETWLPALLVEQGFFKSGSEVKKNNPNLWRDIEEMDHFTLGWADILIWRRRVEA